MLDKVAVRPFCLAVLSSPLIMPCVRPQPVSDQGLALVVSWSSLIAHRDNVDVLLTEQIPVHSKKIAALSSTSVERR